MPNLFKATQRALEIVAQRVGRYTEDVQQQQAEANDTPQRDRRAAYEAVAQADPAQYPMLRQQFDEQYGPEEWRRQETFGLRRQARSEG